MKKITLLFALLIAFIANAQDQVGYKPELLIGKQVKILPIEMATKHGYSGFYNDNELTETYPNGDMFTKFELLVDKVFTVVSVEPFLDFHTKCFKIAFESADKTIIYFKYNPDDLLYYPLQVTGGITVPNDAFCDYIKRLDFTTGVSYSTDPFEGISIEKTFPEGRASYYSFRIAEFFGGKPVNKKGVTVFFENGKKLSWPDYPVSAEYYSNTSFRYFVSPEITAKELELLKNNKITGLQIDVFKMDITQGQTIKGVVNCITAIKN